MKFNTFHLKELNLKKDFSFFSSSIHLYRTRNPPVKGPGIPLVGFSSEFRQIPSSVDVIVTSRSKIMKKMKKKTFFLSLKLKQVKEEDFFNFYNDVVHIKGSILFLSAFRFLYSYNNYRLL